MNGLTRFPLSLSPPPPPGAVCMYSMHVLLTTVQGLTFPGCPSSQHTVVCRWSCLTRGTCLNRLVREGDNLYKKSLTERYAARLVGTFQSMHWEVGWWEHQPLAANLRIPGDLRLYQPCPGSGGSARVDLSSRRTRGTRYGESYIKNFKIQKQKQKQK